LRLEGVADTADGSDVGGVAVAVEFLTQIGDVEVDDVGVDFG
jgi:hypothetical protein